MLWFRKKTKRIDFDPETQEPVIQRSICTGEATAGFRDRATGRFHAYQCIRSPEELEEFCRSTGTSPEKIPTVY